MKLSKPFIPAGGHCFIAQVEQPSDLRDDLVVWEDGRQLGPSNCLHDDIRNAGGGRCSMWDGSVYFSASDNSDPNRNGRDYTVRAYVDPDAGRPVVDLSEDGSVSRIADVFWQHECMLVRRAVSPAKIAWALETAESLFSAQDERAATGAFRNASDREGHANGRLFEADLLEGSAGRLSLFDVIASVPMVQLINALAGPVWSLSRISQIRRVAAPKHREGADWSIYTPYHVDSVYGPIDDRLVVTMWLPLTPHELTAPSLELVLTERADVLSHVSYNPEAPYDPDEFGRSGKFDKDAFEEDRVKAAFPADAFWTPRVRQGDALVFTNWALHRTFATQQMENTRVSLEVRFDTAA